MGLKNFGAWSGAAILMFFTLPSLAAGPNWFGSEADGEWMIGLKTGTMQNAATGFGDANHFGVNFGYQFSRPIDGTGKSSFEIEYSTSHDEGTISVNSDLGAPGFWDGKQLGVFFNYRTQGDIFFKAKIGALQTSVTTNVFGVMTKTKDTSVGYGAGLGYRFGDRGIIELDYLGATGDPDVGQISLGGSLLF